MTARMAGATRSGARPLPALTLFLLSPVVAELLFGATHLTNLRALAPEVCVYGGGAVLVRELVRRWRRGWVAILLLGVAYALIEECAIVQTSLAPLAGATHAYGRVLGVNWVYLLWAVGYEAVWAVVLPIRLTELLFPAHAGEPWLDRRGLAVVAGVFAAGAVGAWWFWTQVVTPVLTHAPAYRAPAATVAAALLVAAGLVALARWAPLPSGGPKAAARRSPWAGGLCAFGVGLAWFVLAALAYVGPPVPVAIPIAAGLVLALAGVLVARRWSARPLALIAGALAASMLAGFLVSGARTPPDLVGKLVLDVAAVGALLWLGRRLAGAGPPAVTAAHYGDAASRPAPRDDDHR